MNVEKKSNETKVKHQRHETKFDSIVCVRGLNAK